MPPQSPYLLDCAEINWLDNNIPQSASYQDIYFARQGLLETQYVFLEGNRLAERWAKLDSSSGGLFTIAETGFGTGLNFLASYKLWMESAPANHRLHYISVEKHPLQREDFQRVLSNWPELEVYGKQLETNYPVLVQGHHLIPFEQGRITLHLLLGDAGDCLGQLLDTPHHAFSSKYGSKVDAWFLDGFSPAKNPELWNEALFHQVAQLSRPGTSYATFTAAGLVRRGLSASGFSVTKRTGYGKKREMIYGEFKSLPENNTEPNRASNAPWALAPAVADKRKKTIVVIGGGLAGVHSAYAMAQRGWQVKLIERNGKLAQEASGNRQGMLYTKLSAQAGTLNQFTLSSYLYALQLYRQLARQGTLKEGQYSFCGLLQLAKKGQDFAQIQSAFAQLPELASFPDAAQASEIAGINMPGEACYFPAAGWISPPALCQELAAHPNIEILLNAEALALEREGQHWQVLSANNKPLAQSEQVIVANSRDATAFSQTEHLPLKSIRGQTTAIDSNEVLASLRTVICHEGYLTPAMSGSHTLGATFDILDNCKNIRHRDHWRNLESLQQALPGCFPDGLDYLRQQTISGRVGFRCNTPDYMPIVGSAPQQQQFLADYAKLRKNARSRIDIPGSYHVGLYLNIGHGSRGLCTTPLCAELLASLICNEPRPLPLKLRNALNPGRFLVRDLIRNKQ